MTKLAICSYCAELREDITVDHVLPTGWYPNSVPEEQRLKAPGCLSCNRALSGPDERLREVLYLSTPPNSALQDVFDRIRRSMDESCGRNERDTRKRRAANDRFFKSVVVAPVSELGQRAAWTGPPPRDEMIRTPAGLLVRGVRALRIRRDDQKMFGARLVRGVFRHETGQALPSGVAMTTALLNGQHDPWAIVQPVAQHPDARLLAVPPAFQYSWYQAPDDPWSTCLVFQVWGAIYFVGMTGSFAQPEAAEDTMTLPILS